MLVQQKSRGSKSAGAERMWEGAVGSSLLLLGKPSSEACHVKEGKVGRP